MSKTTIIQRGVEKQVPAKHAKILVAIGKAAYAPMPDDEAGHGETVDTDAPKPKRTYLRKDLKAQE
jgi:hypothetical protein